MLQGCREYGLLACVDKTYMFIYIYVLSCECMQMLVDTLQIGRQKRKEERYHSDSILKLCVYGVSSCCDKSIYKHVTCFYQIP